MAQYQNFFTQVQVRSTVYPGIPLQPGTWVRTGEGKFNYWLGTVSYTHLTLPTNREV